MPDIKNHVKTNILYGLAVLIPVAVIALVLFQVAKLVVEGARAIGLESGLGVLLLVIAALVGLLVVCYSLGVLISTRLGEITFNRIEQALLMQVPGYEIIKNLLVGFAEKKNNLPVVAVRLFGEGVEELGFLMEERDGKCVVFIPSTPALTVGRNYVVDSDRITRLKAGSLELVNCVGRWGLGSIDVIAPPGEKR